MALDINLNVIDTFIFCKNIVISMILWLLERQNGFGACPHFKHKDLFKKGGFVTDQINFTKIQMCII